MSRNDYDDMTSYSRSTRNGKTYVISFALILVILIAIILFIIFSPGNDESATSSAEQSDAIALDIPEVEEIQVERSTPIATIEVPEKKNVDYSSIMHTYIVKAGDTLSSIARDNGLKEETIINVNNLTDGRLQIGDELTLPLVDGFLYEVKEGDSVESIASRYALSESEIVNINRISDIRAGDVIFLESVLDSSSYTAPSSGEILYHYGDEYNSKKLEGIVISLDAGSTISAVADGIVSDAGIDGEYGRFITITHQNGFKSFYYCLEVVEVKLGDTVAKGDIIATVGTSSRYFGSNALYFKLEEGSNTIDPEIFL